jgi:hypothetical protein
MLLCVVFTMCVKLTLVYDELSCCMPVIKLDSFQNQSSIKWNSRIHVILRLIF